MVTCRPAWTSSARPPRSTAWDAPREVGDVVSFLLSEEASYVNGAKWEIDGGALATIRNDI